jgi:WD40 repeat protein
MRVLTGHTGPIMRLAYRRDGRLLASAGFDGFVRLWDTATGQERGLIASDQKHALSVAFAPDGKTFAAGFGREKGLAQIWKIDPLQRVEEWLAHERFVRTLDYHPDGRELVTGGSDDNVCLWNVFGTPHRGRIPVARTGVARVAFSPDGETVAILDRAGRVALWPLGQRRPSPWSSAGIDLSQKTDHDLAFTPDGQTVILGVNRGLMSITPGRSDARLWPADPPRAVRAVSVSPDGRSLLAADEDGLITHWDVPTRSVRRRLDWEMGDIVTVAFAPDGLTAAAGGLAGFILIWDVDE